MLQSIQCYRKCRFILVIIELLSRKEQNIVQKLCYLITYLLELETYKSERASSSDKEQALCLFHFSSFSSFLSLFGAEKKICARTCSRIIIILLISDIGLKYTQNISYPHRRSVNYPIDNYPEAREIHLDFVQIILRDRWIVRM